MHHPKKVKASSLSAIGITVRTTNSAESNPDTARIGELWNKYFSEGWSDRVPAKEMQGGLLGVYTDYESDQDGQYTCGPFKVVDVIENVPDGMRALEIPSGEYCVFEARGELPGSVLEAWAAVWKYFADEDRIYDRAYQVDYEQYLGETAADLFIGVVPRL